MGRPRGAGANNIRKASARGVEEQHRNRGQPKQYEERSLLLQPLESLSDWESWLELPQLSPSGDNDDDRNNHYLPTLSPSEGNYGNLSGGPLFSTSSHLFEVFPAQITDRVEATTRYLQPLEEPHEAEENESPFDLGDRPQSRSPLPARCHDHDDIPLPWKLAQLQSRLHTLKCRISQGAGAQDAKRSEAILSEALSATETLMLNIEDLKIDCTVRRSTQDSTIPDATFPSPEQSSQASPPGYPHHEGHDKATILQVVTCYLQLLQIYAPLLCLISDHLTDPTAATPSSHLPKPGVPAASIPPPPTILSATFLTCGRFKLASHDDLKVQVTMHLIFSMFRRIQRSLGMTLSAHMHLPGENSASLNEYYSNEERGDGGTSSVLLAVRAAMCFLDVQEKAVFENLRRAQVF
ncbi:hypothetical protein BJY01DRAFT_253667 [Aspergillus pseudoustus]|uniref:Aflatoxin regulatory protein domain-containing protein n=1 Tax=Aspergillus pseudoustus TaxID=1810923 RepID=A0ABR4IZ66_9EURO